QQWEISGWFVASMNEAFLINLPASANPPACPVYGRLANSADTGTFRGHHLSKVGAATTRQSAVLSADRASFGECPWAI
ncbi:hypothetical protein, partial [Pantoea stewartii]|uniref:hypothetical protein n=1 Tax=Pantoea stewartii TaxID=66269 RepID=UPI000AAF99B1